MKRIITILLIALIPMLVMSQGKITRPGKKPQKVITRPGKKPQKVTTHQNNTGGKKKSNYTGNSNQNNAKPTPAPPPETPEQIYQRGLACLGSKDYAESVNLFLKAAEQGHTEAQKRLGECYSNGQGVSQDYIEAVKWYRKAAELGDVDAQYNLGVFYENGQGVSQDYSEAVKWYIKAAEQGNSSALTRLNTTSGKINGHDYVDLGLSVKWATCNVGASFPSDYGDYFAWGETSTKSEYSAKNSKTYKKRKIGDTSGNPQYDAVRSTWGSTWRTPTKKEMDELVEKCRWEWTTQDGYIGYLVTSKTNGNSIFLPAAGWCGGTSSDGVGDYGDYWCSTPFESNSGGAYYLSFGTSNHLVVWGDRYSGLPVRPVTD